MNVGDRNIKHYDVGDKCYIAFDITDPYHYIEISCSTDLKSVVRDAKAYSKEFDVSLDCIQLSVRVKE